VHVPVYKHIRYYPKILYRHGWWNWQAPPGTKPYETLICITVVFVREVVYAAIPRYRPSRNCNIVMHALSPDIPQHACIDA
jgi:hypothetical protein